MMSLSEWSADLRRLASSPRRRILQVTHDWGGGVERHVGDLVELLSPECEILILRPMRDTGGVLALTWANPGERFVAYFEADAYFALVALLDSLAIERIHFHHIHGYPAKILGLPEALHLPYDCTVHDYHAVCPQYHLVTSDGHYCGEPDEEGCRICLMARPSAWNLDITSWRNRFEIFLRGAQRVIAPSRDAAVRLRRYFPGLDCSVWPHPETAVLNPISVGAGRPPSLIKMLVLGGVSPAKGLHVIEACAVDAQRRNLPLHFCILGHTSQPIRQAPELPVTVRGQYAERDLRRLIELERPAAFLFPAQVPETFSYTLSAAMETGLPIFASDLGAFPERLARYREGRLIAWNAAAAEWNDSFLAPPGEVRMGVRVNLRERA